jgi:hypothetical protein
VEGEAGRPSFSELLQRSLLAVNDTRAWVDEAQRYKWVRQSRAPLALPQVLVVNCAGERRRGRRLPGCWKLGA